MSFPLNKLFWSIITEYNGLMREAIKGPDCTNPNLCKGDCCSIKIDVPKVLAKEYIRRNFASKEDFTRSNIYSFQLRFDEKKGKCFLFDREINGCKVHFSGIKPPQCWIYPTNFSNQGNILISCKKQTGWEIIDAEKAKKAEKLLKYYDMLCQIEVKKEIRRILERLENSLSVKGTNLIESLKTTPPSNLGGFQDKWDSIGILPAEGMSLQLKKFCQIHNPKCPLLPDNFLDCTWMCNTIAENLVKFLEVILPKYIKNVDTNQEGQYPLYKLFRFSESIGDPIKLD